MKNKGVEIVHLLNMKIYSILQNRKSVQSNTLLCGYITSAWFLVEHFLFLCDFGKSVRWQRVIEPKIWMYYVSYAMTQTMTYFYLTKVSLSIICFQGRSLTPTKHSFLVHHKHCDAHVLPVFEHISLVPFVVHTTSPSNLYTMYCSISIRFDLFRLIRRLFRCSIYLGWFSHWIKSIHCYYIA